MAADPSIVGATVNLEDALGRIGEDVDRLFHSVLAVPADPRARLFEGMRHAAIGGGKRLRPLLVTAACGLFHVDRARALRVGLAVECIHVYSLIHDDLPCMDDDDLRRGKPTVHKAFDEATAFWRAIRCTRSRSSFSPMKRRTRIRSFGWSWYGARPRLGSVRDGRRQMMDLVAERTRLDLGAVTRLQQLKTGALIGFCLEAGGIMGAYRPRGAALCAAMRAMSGSHFRSPTICSTLKGRGQDRQTRRQDGAKGKELFSSLLGPSAPAIRRVCCRPAVELLASFARKRSCCRGSPAFASSGIMDIAHRRLSGTSIPSRSATWTSSGAGQAR
jgi:farnesyl diphosphate synthase